MSGRLEDAVVQNTVTVLRELAQSIEDKDLDDLATNIETLSHMAGSKKIMKYYIEFAIPHAKQIVEQDENYILSSDCILAQISSGAHLKFLQIWNQATDEDKDFVWKNLQENLKITQRYIET